MNFLFFLPLAWKACCMPSSQLHTSRPPTHAISAVPKKMTGASDACLCAMFANETLAVALFSTCAAGRGARRAFTIMREIEQHAPSSLLPVEFLPSLADPDSSGACMHDSQRRAPYRISRSDSSPNSGTSMLLALLCWAHKARFPHSLHNNNESQAAARHMIKMIPMSPCLLPTLRAVPPWRPGRPGWWVCLPLPHCASWHLPAALLPLEAP